MTTSSFRRSLVLSSALAAFALLPGAPALAQMGHGGHGGAKGAAIGQPGKATAATRTVAITMRDNTFEPDSIAVKAGETVRFVIANKGEFLHEFNIGTAASHTAHQKEMAMMMEHGMITPVAIDREKMKMDHGGMKMGHDGGNSVLVEPGKTAEMVWTFPAATSLEFACNMPGHYEAGMAGPIRFAQ